jgi:hypothetical protein
MHPLVVNIYMIDSLYHNYRGDYIVDNGLKSSIIIEVDDLRSTGSCSPPSSPEKPPFLKLHVSSDYPQNGEKVHRIVSPNLRTPTRTSMEWGGTSWEDRRGVRVETLNLT